MRLLFFWTEAPREEHERKILNFLKIPERDLLIRCNSIPSAKLPHANAIVANDSYRLPGTQGHEIVESMSGHEWNLTKTHLLGHMYQ